MRVTWGSPGGLQYRLLRPPQWTRLPANSLILKAHREGHLVGGYVLARQSWGWLRILLAVAPEEQGQGVGRALVEHAAAWGAKAQHTMAGTIETTNRRSLEMSLKAGYQPVAHLEVRTFTRWRPRPVAGVRRATALDRPHLVEQLRLQGHDWFEPDQVDVDECWVTEDLRAGVQLTPQLWAITSIGLPSILDRPVLASLPLLGIRPRHFQFATGHLWWGDATRWSGVFEHAMRIANLQAIVLTGDETSNGWKEILGAVNMGVVGATIGDESMEVTATQAFAAPLVFSPLNAL